MVSDAETIFRCQRKNWTREETRTLKKLYGTNSNVALSSVLERSRKAIERKAHSLGLLKSKKYLRSLGAE